MISFVIQLTHCKRRPYDVHDNRISRLSVDSSRDLTRIARINDAMWSELFLRNRDALLHQMDIFSKEFDELRRLLAQSDAEGLREKMRLSTRRRAYFDK
jgi:prephenate dehydrogenase